jgi:hypothetical protein
LTTTNDQNKKICKVWFYGENQHIRNKTNLLTLNESASKTFFENEKKIGFFYSLFFQKDKNQNLFFQLSEEKFQKNIIFKLKYQKININVI